jgi:hypothetical protein
VGAPDFFRTMPLNGAVKGMQGGLDLSSFRLHLKRKEELHLEFQDTLRITQFTE